MRTIAAILCLMATLLAQQAVAQQACQTLLVSNNNDVVNGNTSSPCALIANNGGDGISLREAILAAGNATGSGNITITFASSLAGQTITPSSSNGCCYTITRDSVTIAGLTGADGAPAITVDATNMYTVFSVTASNFTLKSMNIIGMGEANVGGVMYGVYVRAGDSGGELQVSDTLIEDNVFSNTPGQATTVIGVVVGAAFPNTAPNAVFSNAVIANNTFAFTKLSSGGTEAVKLQAQGTNSTVQNVSILHNTFTNFQYGIELVPAYLSSGGRILNTDIATNSFSANQQFDLETPVILDPSGDDGEPSTGNAIDHTVIERNVITGVAGPAIQLIGGVGNGSTVSATGNAITNTSIINNLITGDTVYGALFIAGGWINSSGNAVNGVTVINNTFANCGGCGTSGTMMVASNAHGGTNNTVSGVSILNTIFWNNGTVDFCCSGSLDVSPSQVTTSITAQAGFAGVDGNISSNPQFVNSTTNFELQSSSPARGAGTSAGAPPIDLDCQPRGSPPSIGAYEFAGPDICPSNPGHFPADTHDFNGDGYSDILWRNTGGDLAVWLMNGGAVLQSAGLGSVTSAYSIIGQHDFNGDGKADVLWRDSSGNVSMWLMNGTAISSAAGVSNVASNWTLYGTGDLNGDGKGDLLWRDGTTGTVAVWFMNGATVASTASFGAIPNNWTILGDTTGGILWRDTAGDVALWDVQNGQVTDSSGLGTVTSNFVVQGVGDFDGDGNLDILWRDTNSGALSIWFTNGTQVTSGVAVGTLPSNWSVAQVGDYDGNGMSDILLIDSAGDLAVWLMNGAKVSSSAGFGNVGSTWQVQNVNAN